MKSSEWFLSCLFALIIIIASSAFVGWIFMLLWNWLVPLLWNSAPILTFCQAWGLWFFLAFISNLFRIHKS